MTRPIKFLLLGYLAIELTLYVLIFLTTDILNAWISYSAIILNFVMAMILFKKSKNVVLTEVALLMTCLADLFLVILNPQIQLVAMIFFCITQGCYFLRILVNTSSKTQRIWHIGIRAGFCVLGIIATILVLKEKTDALAVISIFYFVNLFLNVIFAFMQTKKSVLFAMGLLLFMFCDILIGLNVASGGYLTFTEGTLLAWLANPSIPLAWGFYVPSQVLIVLSLVFNKYNDNKKIQEKV